MSARTGITGYKTRPLTFLNYIPDDFKDIRYPAMIGFYFVRDSNRRFDFHNAVQILADLFVSFGLIADDDCAHFLPVPVCKNGNCYHKDKNKSCVIVYYD